MELLASIAAEHGSPLDVQEQIRGANTARHVIEICQVHELEKMPSMICTRTRSVCEKFAREKLWIEVTMVDFDGKTLGFDELRKEPS
jgi:cobalt-precorrin-5B (C1)-methyltransferase